jgi:transposase
MEQLVSERKALDTHLRQAARKDAVYLRLMTIPGVGPITSLAFRVTVDDPARFDASKAVGAHVGLTPRIYQSGETDLSRRRCARGLPIGSDAASSAPIRHASCERPSRASRAVRLDGPCPRVPMSTAARTLAPRRTDRPRRWHGARRA